MSEPAGPPEAPPPGSPEATTVSPHPQAPSEDAGVQRFSITERLSHWVYAFFFLVAFITGFLMWLPATREWLGGARRDFAHFHGGMGLLMIGVPLVLLLVLDRRRLAADLREVDRWDQDDRRWFWMALRGGTLRGLDMPPQRRLNAGQKANSVLVAALAAGFVITGSLLLAKAHLPAWLVSRALWLHGFLVIAGVALFLGHLGHVFLTRHGRDSLRAMVHGRMKLETAFARHGKWDALPPRKTAPPGDAASPGDAAHPHTDDSVPGHRPA